jgi:hypothetical protein
MRVEPLEQRWPRVAPRSEATLDPLIDRIEALARAAERTTVPLTDDQLLALAEDVVTLADDGAGTVAAAMPRVLLGSLLASALRLLERATCCEAEATDQLATIKRLREALGPIPSAAVEPSFGERTSEGIGDVKLVRERGGHAYSPVEVCAALERQWKPMSNGELVSVALDFSVDVGSMVSTETARLLGPVPVLLTTAMRLLVESDYNVAKADELRRALAIPMPPADALTVAEVLIAQVRALFEMPELAARLGAVIDRRLAELPDPAKASAALLAIVSSATPSRQTLDAALEALVSSFFHELTRAVQDRSP